MAPVVVGHVGSVVSVVPATPRSVHSRSPSTTMSFVLVAPQGLPFVAYLGSVAPLVPDAPVNVHS
jgi:hypothetical protein